jgi:hypothetical protein
MEHEFGRTGINWQEVDQALSAYDGARRVGNKPINFKALKGAIKLITPPLIALALDTGEYLIAEDPLDTHSQVFGKYNSTRTYWQEYAEFSVSGQSFSFPYEPEVRYMRLDVELPDHPGICKSVEKMQRNGYVVLGPTYEPVVLPPVK